MSQTCTALNMKPELHDNHQHSSIQKTMVISDIYHSLQDIPCVGNCKIEVGSKVYKELTSMIKGNRQSPSLSVRADLGGHLKYSRRWSGVRAGVLLGAQGAVRRGENRGGL